MQIQDRLDMNVKHLTPLKAIRRHCLDCAGRPKEVRLCSIDQCNLYRFRQGHNPARKWIGPKIGSSSTLKGILSHSTQDSEENRSQRCFAMPKDRSLNQVAENKEKRPIEIEGQGKIQICRAGKEILIKVTTDI